VLRSIDAARSLLEAFFPIGDLPTIDTIQRRTVQVGARLECEAIVTPTPLPPPADAETIALSIDSGHLRGAQLSGADLRGVRCASQQ
jgi:hypothetical protein